MMLVLDSESRLDGDLSEPMTGGGGGHSGILIVLKYMSNIEAWPIFSGRLTKVDSRVVHSLIMQLSERYFLGFKILNFNIFGGFQKNEY